uniref:Uncharacterized protein n=1 Tax=Myotis myotis TaxID=51298 RepID=A0A7J7ZYL1_MYOMY|nr:hypothetical protein mMyoMyo1_009974 [Myotis myotis]
MLQAAAVPVPLLLASTTGEQQVPMAGQACNILYPEIIIETGREKNKQTNKKQTPDADTHGREYQNHLIAGIRNCIPPEFLSSPLPTNPLLKPFACPEMRRHEPASFSGGYLKKSLSFHQHLCPVFGFTEAGKKALRVIGAGFNPIHEGSTLMI